jgi:hypothetical protein
VGAWSDFVTLARPRTCCLALFGVGGAVRGDGLRPDGGGQANQRTQSRTDLTLWYLPVCRSPRTSTSIASTVRLARGGGHHERRTPALLIAAAPLTARRMRHLRLTASVGARGRRDARIAARSELQALQAPSASHFVRSKPEQTVAPIAGFITKWSACNSGCNDHFPTNRAFGRMTRPALQCDMDR